MVDFNSLRKERNNVRKSHIPQDIFRRLPKPEGMNDLYESQGHVLTEWYGQENKKDTVIKLHTGGGKTLVGLLIAQSSMEELTEPALYLCPTKQLVQQTLEKARQLNIKVAEYKTGEPLDNDFLHSKAIMVCTYNAVFNGKTKFGLRDSLTPVNVGTIIFDDAHASFSIIRDCFTLEINKKECYELYEYVALMFQIDFDEIGKLETFNDIIKGDNSHDRDNILEIPYWAWIDKIKAVQSKISECGDSKFPFKWSLLRDNLSFCHAFITCDKISVTPYLPLLDIFPTFDNAQRKIYMSATIADDSEIIKTFNTPKESVLHPISSSSLAGVSERMILIPQLMSTPEKLELDKLVTWATEKKAVATVILTSSYKNAESWREKLHNTNPNIPENAGDVEEAISSLQANKTVGPVVFANRYDGIDLQGKACRLLIMDDLPIGSSNYDLYKAKVLYGSKAIDRFLAQRIEQGIGRGARGAGDYCVVILTGSKLTSWISKENNLELITQATRVQIDMGIEMSKEVSSTKELAATIVQSFSRNQDWVSYHAETLADEVENKQNPSELINSTERERKAFEHWRNNEHSKALNILEKLYSREVLDQKFSGWLMQFAAKIAYCQNEHKQSSELQKGAFSKNRDLFKPSDVHVSQVPQIPTEQSEAIAEKINEYKYRDGLLKEFEDVINKLNPNVSANIFEEALMQLGLFLGFISERHDKNGDGSDIIWLLPSKKGLVLEAKSKKKKGNPLNKDEHGQILVAEEWFKKEYPDYSCVKVSVLAVNCATHNAHADRLYALTFDKLLELANEVRSLYKELCKYDNGELQIKCAKLLEKSRINPSKIEDSFLQQFVVKHDI